MDQRLLLAVFILVAVIVPATPARADFLGLAPGDYTVTLLGCAGDGCVGAMHIGSPGATGFDWHFELDVVTFDFPMASSGPTSDAASEQADDGSLLLQHDHITGENTWSFHLPPVVTVSGLWTAISQAVPEPATGFLLLFGFSALALQQWLRSSPE